MRLRLFTSVSLCLSSAAAFSTTNAQVIAVRELSAPEARSADHFGLIMSVRALSSGALLVNDGRNRQLVSLDAKLGGRTVLFDSVAAGGQSYGPRATPIIPYLGDSTLFVDFGSLSLLVLGPTGTVARVIAAPKPGDVRLLSATASGVDAKGNLVYRGVTPRSPAPAGDNTAALVAMLTPADSVPIVRANFESRTVDTLGRVRQSTGQRTSSVTANGKTEITMYQNPIANIDEWAVLADGSVALVRGFDYHVDLLRADGTTTKGDKLPFDWKRLSDTDKQGLIDSARTARKALEDAAKVGATRPSGAQDVAAVGGFTVVRAKSAESPVSSAGAPDNGPSIKLDYVGIADVVDYWPPIRIGAAKADADGNLWILPTTSAQSKDGELVYDVVSNRGALMHRVRVPKGRSIAGFAKNGVVYLMYKDGDAGWLLERTRLVTTMK